MVSSADSGRPRKLLRMSWRLTKTSVINSKSGKKRYVKIEDITNRRFYDGYFSISMTKVQIQQRFVDIVKAHRAEIAAQQPLLDLTNFETQVTI